MLVVLDTEPEWGGEHQYASVMMDCILQITDGKGLLAICSNRYWRKWCREKGIHILDIQWYSFSKQEQEYHIKYPLFSRIYCMYMSTLGKIIRREKVKVVLCTRQGVFIPNLSARVLSPVHDLMHRYEGHFPEVGKGYDARELIFASKARYAWCVLTDSKVGKYQFMESYLPYMRRRQPHIISLPFVVPKHIAECEEEYIEIPPKYIFYPAQFWQHKNHLNLLRAIRILATQIRDIHLVLTGSEKNNLKRIQDYISENHLDANVTIKGFVSDGNITYLYKNAVGLIMPSYFGPTNIPPLEAMALGCPVAVSNKYAMPEQVGDAGLLFNPDSPEEMAECIKKMWCDDHLRQQMIQKGYKRMGRWTQENFCEKLGRIINKI